MTDRPTTADPVAPRRRWKTLALFAGGIAAGLLVAEVVLSLIDRPRFYQPHTFPPQFKPVGDPDAEGWLRHVNMPSDRIRFIYDGDPRGYFGPGNAVEHATNSLGFRDDEFPLLVGADGSITAVERKSPGEFRVVFLGDSVTFGEGVRREDTFVERTRELLDRGLASGNLQVETFNFGVGGHNASDAAWVLDQFALKLAPDLVVLVIGPNDAEEPLLRGDAASRTVIRQPRSIEPLLDRLSQPPDRWYYRPRLTRLAWQFVAARERADATISYYRSICREDEPGWQRCRDALARVRERCRERGIPLRIVIVPILLRLDDYPLAEIHQRLKPPGVHPVVVIDLLPHLAHLGAADLVVHPSDPHPNERVHSIAARVLSRNVIDSLRHDELKPPGE